jgi:hypothetical protein
MAHIQLEGVGSPQGGNQTLLKGITWGYGPNEGQLQSRPGPFLGEGIQCFPSLGQARGPGLEPLELGNQSFTAINPALETLRSLHAPGAAPGPHHPPPTGQGPKADHQAGAGMDQMGQAINGHQPTGRQ